MVQTEGCKSPPAHRPWVASTPAARFVGIPLTAERPRLLSAPGHIPPGQDLPEEHRPASAEAQSVETCPAVSTVNGIIRQYDRTLFCRYGCHVT